MISDYYEAILDLEEIVLCEEVKLEELFLCYDEQY